jgi:hypothetical protein
MEAINKIKNCLLHLESFDDVETFTTLQEEIRRLIGVPGIRIGITPFYFFNNSFEFFSIHNVNSIFLKKISTEKEKERLSLQLKEHFDKNPEPLVIPEFNDETLRSYPFLTHLHKEGWKGIIICPLINYNNLIGVLEIVSENEMEVTDDIVDNIEIALPLFELALHRSRTTLNARIDKVIKEQFTAIQPSVEWRFTEATLNYLRNSEEDPEAKMEPILFNNVFPLYGAIDIRNSSTERNKAIQLDMLEQLDMAAAIIAKAENKKQFPLLREINYKIKKYKHSVSNIVLSDEEIAINQFLKNDVVELFEQLKTIVPSLDKEIGKYFAAINSSVDMVYHHRKELDESITAINKAIAKFIDTEQKAAQNIYPHYFERFVTDGVDFNIYVGQSIAPGIPFSDFYLRNLKIWQMSTLAKAAQLSQDLLADLSVPLQTTQLLLAHEHPISISFRPAERKFDVDGAYNIRYEIVKKRIDKVHLRDSNERLTQPGKLAIVYSQPREAEEYLEYIEFLTNEKLLTGEVEKLDLEELQGVSGLKALRIGINISQEKKPGSELKTEAHKG